MYIHEFLHRLSLLENVHAESSFLLEATKYLSSGKTCLELDNFQAIKCFITRSTRTIINGLADHWNNNH